MANSPKIFGILNVTPDSFSDGGKFADPEKAVIQAKRLIKNGAHFIDVGGESTKPNATEISPEEEWERIEAVLGTLLNSELGILISLDTKNPSTAQNFSALGGRTLNDVSGFNDPEMVDIAPCFDKIIVNHFPGDTLDEVHSKNIDSVNQVVDELLERKETLMDAGVRSGNIILDPGIGFGKSMDLNWQLLEIAKLLPDDRILIGHSKKRFLGKDRFNPLPNVKAAKIAVKAGCHYLRAHDPQFYKNSY